MLQVLVQASMTLGRDLPLGVALEGERGWGAGHEAQERDGG